MSSPFAGTGNFAPITREKNAREQLIEYAENHGWLLDLNATRHRHTWKRDTEEQDPNRFVRTAAHGGEWCILLDYEVMGEPDAYKPHRSWDNTLRAIAIWHSSWVDEKGIVFPRFELRNYLQFNAPRSALWDVTNHPDGKVKPLRKRAEDLLRDPDLAVWLVLEDQNSAAEAERRRKAEWEADRRARRRPLPITISKDLWRRELQKLARAANELINADGLTDLHELVKTVEDHLDVVREALVEKEPNCFYCDEPIAEGDRALDPSNQRTYGPCCREHALRWEKKSK